MVAPLTYEQLITAISNRHATMSRRFQQVARYIVQNPNSVALDSVKAIAANAGVQPSTLVRFAQALDYGGFSEMQKVFQSRLLTSAPGFRERLEALRTEVGETPETANLAFLRQLAVADMAGLQHLLDTVEEAELEAAAKLMAGARTIYVLGQLRAFPVASYISYALTHLRRDSRLIDGAGGLAGEQAALMGPEDLLLAVSFRHYAREVVDIAEAAGSNDVPILAITDSQLSPLAKRATCWFEVPEGEFNFSRSLAAPMCLAQALIICMAHALTAEGDASPEAAALATEALAEVQR
jgi:DNA-binding MurR/RpiR family transcriptional regulator